MDEADCEEFEESNQASLPPACPTPMEDPADSDSDDSGRLPASLKQAVERGSLHAYYELNRVGCHSAVWHKLRSASPGGVF